MVVHMVIPFCTEKHGFGTSMVAAFGTDTQAEWPVLSIGKD
jgi:hypothetical protein